MDSVNSVVKPNKLSTNLENFVAVPYWTLSLVASLFAVEDRRLKTAMQKCVKIKNYFEVNKEYDGPNTFISHVSQCNSFKRK